jgi:carboxymethylenebutenolidase
MKRSESTTMPMPSEQKITLDVRGEPCPALLFRPVGPGPYPGIAVGQEATGPNELIRGIGAALAHLGYATVVPDYYHGSGPPDPEDYEDIQTIVGYVAGLDFRRATYDLMEAVEYLKRLPEVDESRLGVWGYCTGATITLLAACLRSDLAATVLFYPSQPRFDALGTKKPVHAVDMLWNLTSPVLLMVGDQDPVWPPELLADVGDRLSRWGIDHTIKTYAGAGHAFTAPAPMFHHADADRASWSDAVAFVGAHLT